MGFFRGFLAPFRGGAYIARNRLWHYLFVPFILDVALALAAAYGAVRYWRAEGWMAQLLQESPGLGWIALVLFSALLGVLLFLIAQPLLNAVFADRLSERVERDARGAAPAVPFLASTGRALLHGVLKLALYGTAAFAAWVLTGFLLGIGALVSVGLAAIFLAYDGFDYPLSRRGATFGKKWAYLVRHPAQTLGFGLGSTILYLIPLAVFVAPPFVAAGATLVFLEVDGGFKAGKGADKHELGKGPAAKEPGEKVA